MLRRVEVDDVEWTREGAVREEKEFWLCRTSTPLTVSLVLSVLLPHVPLLYGRWPLRRIRASQTCFFPFLRLALFSPSSPPSLSPYQHPAANAPAYRQAHDLHAHPSLKEPRMRARVGRLRLLLRWKEW